MKHNELKEIKNKTEGELVAELKKQMAELSKAKLDANLGKTKNKHIAGSIKKNIAQIKTVIQIIKLNRAKA